MTASTALVVGGGIGLGAVALGRAIRHEPVASTSRECAKTVAVAGLPIAVAMTVMMFIALASLLTA